MFDPSKEGGIVISTYTMLSMSFRDEKISRMTQSALVRQKVQQEVPWGLVILDEVQVVPA